MLPVRRTLKDPKDFKLIGSDVHRLDTAAKSNGEAIFTIDISLPDMLTALVVHPDVFGAKVDELRRHRRAQDPGRGRREGGAAGRRGLRGDDVGGDPGPRRAEGRVGHFRRGDALLGDDHRRVSGEGESARRRRHERRRRRRRRSARPRQTLEAEYVFPYLAHAPDGAARRGARQSRRRHDRRLYRARSCRPCDQSVDRRRRLGSIRAQVRVHTQFAGGSFGRRAQAGSPYCSGGGGGLQGVRRRIVRSSISGCARTTFAAATIGRSTCTG